MSESNLSNYQDPVKIPLWGRGGVRRGYTLIDAGDAAWVNQHRWNMLCAASDKRYAIRHEIVAGKSVSIMLHREILGLPRGVGRRSPQGDHIDGDALNNQRSNLRVLPSHAANMQNRRTQVGTSKYRGVSWRKSKQRWRAMVQINGRSIWGGTYATEIEAAQAAEALRRVHLPFSQPDPLLCNAA